MNLLRVEVFLVAAVLTAPAFWASLVEGRVPLETVLLRYLMAVALCALGYAVLRSLEPRPAEGVLVDPVPAPAEVPHRRRTDVLDVPAVDEPTSDIGAAPVPGEEAESDGPPDGPALESEGLGGSSASR